jgi:hypothetical protein
MDSLNAVARSPEKEENSNCGDDDEIPKEPKEHRKRKANKQKKTRQSYYNWLCEVILGWYAVVVLLQVYLLPCKPGFHSSMAGVAVMMMHRIYMYMFVHYAAEPRYPVNVAPGKHFDMSQHPVYPWHWMRQCSPTPGPGSYQRAPFVFSILFSPIHLSPIHTYIHAHTHTHTGMCAYMPTG